MLCQSFACEMRRSAPKHVRKPLTPKQRQALAASAQYTGSAEHKDRRWWGGLPRGRQLPGGRAGRVGKQKTTICPRTGDSDRERATEWVREAIKQGNYQFVQTDQKFPKKLWYRDDSGQYWFGYCINTASGEYKGWPIDESEHDEIFGRVD